MGRASRLPGRAAWRISQRRDHRARLRPAGDDHRGVGDRGDGLEVSGRSGRHKTRLRLRLPRLGPAYEEVFQDIFAIHGGERLLANLAMQGHIAEA